MCVCVRSSKYVSIHPHHAVFGIVLVPRKSVADASCFSLQSEWSNPCAQKAARVERPWSCLLPVKPVAALAPRLSPRFFSHLARAPWSLRPFWRPFSSGRRVRGMSIESRAMVSCLRIGRNSVNHWAKLAQLQGTKKQFPFGVRSVS